MSCNAAARTGVATAKDTGLSAVTKTYVRRDLGPDVGLDGGAGARSARSAGAAASGRSQCTFVRSDSRISVFRKDNLCRTWKTIQLRLLWAKQP